jgi:3-oxoacyl-[acyl-carrier protein] reductase
MDLGIRGKKAIVCGSSQGLGKGCALALAQAGVSLVINGRRAAVLDKTARAIRETTGVDVVPVVADIGTQEGQAALLTACPEPDILVNNAGGPPYRDFRTLDRAAIAAGVTMNMIVPIELIQRVIGSMTDHGFGRIVNITSISVKMAVTGLDVSSGARAGLTAFLAGVCRSVADRNVTINQLLRATFIPNVCEKDSLRQPSARESWKRRPPMNGNSEFRRSASGMSKSLARLAPSFAACTPATSLGRIF